MVLRKERGATLVEVAARAGVDPSTIYRFENEGRWPKDPDRTVAAYGEVVGVKDAREIWEAALRRWRRGGASPKLPSAPVDPIAQTAEELEREIDAALEQQGQVEPESEEAPRAKGRGSS